jgi:hypothetical protein
MFPNFQKKDIAISPPSSPMDYTVTKSSTPTKTTAIALSPAVVLLSRLPASKTEMKTIAKQAVLQENQEG